eukprot:322418-Hanusia_phi.AAC.1
MAEAPAVDHHVGLGRQDGRVLRGHHFHGDLRLVLELSDALEVLQVEAYRVPSCCLELALSCPMGPGVDMDGLIQLGHRSQDLCHVVPVD